MVSRTGRRLGPATIDRRRAKITAEIAALGLPLPGSLVERRTRCGNTGCHCHGDPPQLHGPYLTWTRKVDNTTLTRTPDPAPPTRRKPNACGRCWTTPAGYANSSPSSRPWLCDKSKTIQHSQTPD